MLKKTGLLLCTMLTFSMSAMATGANAGAENTPIGACAGGHSGQKLGSKIFSLPRPGVESTVEVGQTMVSSYKTDLLDATNNYQFVLNEPTKLSGSAFGQGFTLTLHPVSINMVEGMSYRPAEYVFQYANDSSPRTGLSKPDVSLTMSLPSREVVAKVKVGFGEQKIVAGTAALVTRPQCTVTGADSFQKELVYSGIAKGVITILYREFIGDLARPAFSQELHFDLSDGDEIGYKGSRFKVIKANNLGITYMVTKSLE